MLKGFEGDAGAGMVKASVNGHLEVPIGGRLKVPTLGVCGQAGFERRTPVVLASRMR
jgi:hypothetical protein